MNNFCEKTYVLTCYSLIGLYVCCTINHMGYYTPLSNFTLPLFDSILKLILKYVSQILKDVTSLNY